VSAFVIALSVTPTISADTNQEPQLCSCLFEPNHIPLLAREAWCEENIEACNILCSNHGLEKQLRNASNTHMNSCSPENLEYTCQCSDKSWPPLSDYFNSIPSRICIASHGSCLIKARYEFEDGELVMFDYGYGMVPKLKDRARVVENFKYCDAQVRADCPQELVPGMQRLTPIGAGVWMIDDETIDLLVAAGPDDFPGDKVKEEKPTELVNEMEQRKSPCGSLLKLNPRLEKHLLVFLALLAILAFVGSVLWMKAIIERQRKEAAKTESHEEGYIQEKGKFSEKEIGSQMEKEMLL